MNKTIEDMALLARRSYPNLEANGACSRHRNDGHFECEICYPDWHRLLGAHMEVQQKLYDELLELSGLSDPQNGRVGTNAIVENLREQAKIADRMAELLQHPDPAASRWFNEAEDCLKEWRKAKGAK